MRIGSLVVAASMALAMGLGFTANESYAGDAVIRGSGRIVDRIRPHGGRIQDLVVPGGFFVLPEPRPFELQPVRNGKRFPNRFIGSGATYVGIYAPPLAYTTGDPGYADPGYYAPMEDPTGGFGGQPVYYAQPPYVPPAYTVSATPPPPPPPMPSVIEYPNGRFELRGDGVTSPYNWVWIPNPPPPPPVAGPGPGYSPPTAYSPPAPGYLPPSPTTSDDRLSLDRPSSSSRRLYRWTDENGVINVTDRLDAVPSKYRPQAAQTPPS